jgi:hypothetical protein
VPDFFPSTDTSVFHKEIFPNKNRQFNLWIPPTLTIERSLPYDGVSFYQNLMCRTPRMDRTPFPNIDFCNRAWRPEFEVMGTLIASGFSGLVVSILPSGTQVRRFKAA